MEEDVAKSTNIINLHNELIAMPEYKLMLRIRTFQGSLKIFTGNYNQLKKLLSFHTNMPQALPLWDVANRDKLYAFQGEVTRLLHNFVASAMSLIDHSRVLYQELYESKGRFPEYGEERESRFTKNPLASFVVCLRQYFQHYKVPIVFSKMRWSRESPMFDSRLKLSKVDLEGFSGWKSPAKKFLVKQEDSIDLISIVNDYYALVTDFYQWFGTRQREIHREEFEKVHAKRRELAEFMIREEVKSILTNTNQRERNLDEAFAAILTSQELNELKKYRRNSTERYDKLITFLEKITPLDQSLKEQIRQVYGLDF